MDVKELSRQLATNSIVTKVLARYLLQVLEYVDQTHIKPLEKELADLRMGAGAWRDIASAPQDGTIFLAYTIEAQRPTPCLCWWGGDKWMSTGKPEKFVSNPHGWWPTHWQPMPGIGGASEGVSFMPAGEPVGYVPIYGTQVFWNEFHRPAEIPKYDSWVKDGYAMIPLYAHPQTMASEHQVILGAQKIFEVFCDREIDWSTVDLDGDESILKSADWMQAMRLSRAALNAGTKGR